MRRTRMKIGISACLVGIVLLLAGYALARSSLFTTPHATAVPPPDPYTGFWLGWYTDAITAQQRLPRYRTAGVSLVVVPPTARRDMDRFLRALWKDRVRALIEVEQRWVEDGNLRALQAFVRRHADDPA